MTPMWGHDPHVGSLPTRMGIIGTGRRETPAIIDIRPIDEAFGRYRSMHCEIDYCIVFVLFRFVFRSELYGIDAGRGAVGGRRTTKVSADQKNQ